MSSRRFRAAKDIEIKDDLETKLREEFESLGRSLPQKKSTWDYNVITPGTPFMSKLAIFLRYYIQKRVSQDEAWQGVRVILSDASVPGEGEHKIMEFIRRQRPQVCVPSMLFVKSARQ